LEILTASRLRDFRACNRRHYYKYVRKLTAVRESETARFGTLFHFGLESWWMGYRDPQETRLATMLESLRGKAKQMTIDAVDLIKTEELLFGYDKVWSADDSLEIEAVEVEFEIPLVNPETGASSRTFRLRGKIDGVARRKRDDRKVLIEHKSTTLNITEGSEYWRRTPSGRPGLDVLRRCVFGWTRRGWLSLRRCQETWAKNYSKPPHSKIASLRSRPKPNRPRLYSSQRAEDETLDDFRARVREGIAESFAETYQRGFVVRDADEMEENRFDVWQTAQMLQNAIRTDRHPRNPDACVQYGRTCEYFDICTGVADPTDTTLFRQRDVVHPELSRPVAE
jgi:hypothetical protein